MDKKEFENAKERFLKEHLKEVELQKRYVNSKNRVKANHAKSIVYCNFSPALAVIKEIAFNSKGIEQTKDWIVNALLELNFKLVGENEIKLDGEYAMIQASLDDARHIKVYENEKLVGAMSFCADGEIKMFSTCELSK